MFEKSDWTQWQSVTNEVSVETIERHWTGLTCYVTGESFTIAVITVGTNASQVFFPLQQDQSFRFLLQTKSMESSQQKNNSYSAGEMHWFKQNLYSFEDWQ